MKNWLTIALGRLRASWGVLTARRYIIVTYDPKQPPNVLGTIYLGAPCQEAPARLAAATMATVLRHETLLVQGQESALELARQVLAQAERRSR